MAERKKAREAKAELAAQPKAAAASAVRNRGKKAKDEKESKKQKCIAPSEVMNAQVELANGKVRNKIFPEDLMTALHAATKDVEESQ